MEKNKKPILYLTVGLSGSGKSTYLKSKFHPDIIVSPDNIRKEFTGNISDHSQEVRVWNEVRKRINDALKTNGEAVLDATNVDSGLRGKFLKNYPGVEKIALIFRTNPEVAKQRIAKDLSSKVDRSAVPPEVIDRQYKKLMAGYSNLQHQFDKMEYVTENTMIERTLEGAIRSKIVKILYEGIHQGMYIEPSEVPQAVKDWVKETTKKSIQKYTLHQGSKVNINIPWHEGDINYYQAFRLSPDGKSAYIHGPTAVRKGWESDNPGTQEWKDETMDVPSGFIVAKAGVYPPRVEIYTSSDAQQFLPSSFGFELTDHELITLAATRGLKAFARPKIGKKDDPEYHNKILQSLIDKGLMSKNKSITNAGRNYLNQPEIVEKAREAIKGFESRTGRYLGINL